MAGPNEPAGVEAQAGDGQEPGVPGPEGMAPVGGVPDEPGMTQQIPGVPPEPTMAQQPPGGERTASTVTQGDLDTLRSELNRQNFEWQQRAMAAEQRAQDLEIQTKTAGMDDDEKFKYLYERSQEQIGQMRQQQDGFQQLIQAQYYIAEQAGINPGDLNPTSGVYGMMEQAFKVVNARKGQAPAPYKPQLAPSQPAQPPTPKAPSAPSSTAPPSSFQEWASGATLAERQKKIPKGKKAFAEWMEELGEE